MRYAWTMRVRPGRGRYVCHATSRHGARHARPSHPRGLSGLRDLPNRRRDHGRPGLRYLRLRRRRSPRPRSGGGRAGRALAVRDGRARRERSRSEDGQPAVADAHLRAPRREASPPMSRFPRIASIKARVAAGGDYHDRERGHWLVDSKFATPMSVYERYRGSRTEWGINVLGRPRRGDRLRGRHDRHRRGLRRRAGLPDHRRAFLPIRRRVRSGRDQPDVGPDVPRQPLLRPQGIAGRGDQRRGPRAVGLGLAACAASRSAT